MRRGCLAGRKATMIRHAVTSFRPVSAARTCGRLERMYLRTVAFASCRPWPVFSESKAGVRLAQAGIGVQFAVTSL